MKLSPGDRVVVDSDNIKHPQIRVYSDVSGSIKETGSVSAGSSGVVLSLTSHVAGEDRFVRVLFSDKTVYLSERYLKKENAEHI